MVRREGSNGIRNLLRTPTPLAPEVFLAAASQRTKQIRLGHGIIQLTTNHPARVAERVSTLDLVSNGRVELGIGEGSSTTELHPFGRRFRNKREVMPEFHDREPAHQEWKKSVLAGEIELQEIDTAGHGFRREKLGAGEAAVSGSQRQSGPSG